MKLLFSLLLLATLALVSAHVTITPNQIASGATTIINLQLSHGCNSTSLTNKVVVRFPSNITNIKPIDRVGWKLTRTSELLGYNTAAGSEAFYYNFTWEVDPTIYQGLPDWAFDVLSVRVTMPAATSVAVGSRFYIPVWQYCTGGLLDAWIITSSSSSDSHSSSDLPAPSFTVLDPTDVQFIPSQANVKSLEARVANLTSTVQALTGSNPTSKSNTTAAPTTAPTTTPIINNGANTINYYEDSSSWSKADTISVIAIILAGISILVSVILTMKIASIEKQNAILSK